MYSMFLVGDCFGLAQWVNNLFIFLKGTRLISFIIHCQPVFEPWPGDSLAFEIVVSGVKILKSLLGGIKPEPLAVIP